MANMSDQDFEFTEHPVNVAIRAVNPEIVKILVDSGMYDEFIQKVNKPHSFDYVPWVIANDQLIYIMNANPDMLPKILEIVKLLVDKDVDVNMPINVTGATTFNLLPSDWRCAELLEYILNKHPNPPAIEVLSGSGNFTPLAVCLWWMIKPAVQKVAIDGYIKIAELLLANGAKFENVKPHVMDLVKDEAENTESYIGQQLTKLLKKHGQL